ncbi:DUF2786 domain-containing protein [Jatrophihabitans fulvus]
MEHTEGGQQAGTERQDDPLVTRAVEILSTLFGLHGLYSAALALRLSTEFARLPLRTRSLATAAVSGPVVAAAIDRGWSPADVTEHLRRAQGHAPAEAVLAEFAAHLASYPPGQLDPGWSVDDALDASRTQFEVRMAALLTIAQLPTIAPVLPRPGTERVVGRATADEKVLRRIRGLLAKAEASEFEHEADAFSEKAQALMTEHSVARAHLEADGRPTPPATRRIWIDNPYVKAKATLIAQVADANRCRAVVSANLGFVTVFGFDADLDFVDLLSTSLLVQATRAMRQAGSVTSWAGQSRTKSFRQSFLVAYAYRIGERLRESAERVTAAADEARGGALVPVLDARKQEVDAAVSTAFPTLGHMSLSVSNGSGYGAGRAAADQARLDVQRSVTRPA